MNQQYILNKVLSKRNTPLYWVVDNNVVARGSQGLHPLFSWIKGSTLTVSVFTATIECTPSMSDKNELKLFSFLSWSPPLPNCLLLFPLALSCWLAQGLQGWKHCLIHNNCSMSHVPSQTKTKNTPVDYFILKMYKRMTSKLWNSFFPLVSPQIWNWFSAHQGWPMCSLSPLGLV